MLKWNNKNRNIYWFIEFFVVTHNHIRYWKWTTSKWVLRFGMGMHLVFQYNCFKLNRISKNVPVCCLPICFCIYMPVCACVWLLRRQTDWMSQSRYETEKWRVILKSNSSALLFPFKELLKRCKLAYGKEVANILALAYTIHGSIILRIQKEMMNLLRTYHLSQQGPV